MHSRVVVRKAPKPRPIESKIHVGFSSAISIEPNIPTRPEAPTPTTSTGASTVRATGARCSI